MKKEKWIWQPHAGHFIGSSSCNFRMNTYVGKYIVSTVGEYKNSLTKEGEWEPLGMDRLYETMVFKAQRSGYGCCKWRIIVEKEMDMKGYNDEKSAYKGHLELCKKWSSK